MLPPPQLRRRRSQSTAERRRRQPRRVSTPAGTPEGQAAATETTATTEPRPATGALRPSNSDRHAAEPTTQPPAATPEPRLPRQRTAPARRPPSVAPSLRRPHHRRRPPSRSRKPARLGRADSPSKMLQRPRRRRAQSGTSPPASRNARPANSDHGDPACGAEPSRERRPRRVRAADRRDPSGCAAVAFDSAADNRRQPSRSAGPSAAAPTETEPAQSADAELRHRRQRSRRQTQQRQRRPSRRKARQVQQRAAGRGGTVGPRRVRPLLRRLSKPRDSRFEISGVEATSPPPPARRLPRRTVEAFDLAGLAVAGVAGQPEESSRVG